MDRFKQLETVVAVATLGSLSAAARAEGVAPALIGRRIDALEARLGVKLLMRTTRRITLTPEGENFIDEARNILRELEDAEAMVAQGGATPTGHLRLTAPAGFGRRHVAPLLPGFLAAYPGVSASLDLTDRLTDLVRERYDCAVRVGDVVDANLVAIHLAENRRVVVASPTYLATHGTPRAPADLLQHNCLTLGAGSSQHRGWLFRQAGENVVQRVNGNLSCSDGAALLDWALAGLGLAWRSLWEVRQALADGELVTVLDDVAAPPNAIHALLPQRKHLPLRVRVFVDYLRQHYTDPRYWAQAQAAD
ncbi:LysR family transcriptional regulator [Achromobacter sp. GG226]|uniref:LysR family transcriptional regulator n=1 Tax=Verticiella alkaliphila TaxID=2779529 RepID=UPI001C0B3E17|nr:LysR family transcriptional regulator [Verticiella sp. GG226]MBU4611862.1 LysR family transcriptional regulator [Verticiella sp. GG226]